MWRIFILHFFCWYVFKILGLLANRFGGKYLFGGGIFLTAILTLLTPVFTTWSIYLLIAARVLEGIFEVTLFTCERVRLQVTVDRRELPTAVCLWPGLL